MKTECSREAFLFHGLGRREIVARFDGGDISSDAGALLLREAERATGLIDRVSACFTDHRDPRFTEHTLEELLAQRIYGIALGYEDLVDHDELRRDPLIATLVGKRDLKGQHRRRASDRGKPLAGKSTLNRLELGGETVGADEAYKKIVLHSDRLDRGFVDLFLEAHDAPPGWIEIDLDATDFPIFGKQEDRHFHGYYDQYCYLPLYIFSGDHLLGARLRPSNIDGAEGSVDDISRIVTQIREAWPEVEILVRGDSGFCREDLMAWCEAHDVLYVLGFAKNDRLRAVIEEEMAQARAAFEESETAERVFKDFVYRTRTSWSRERRVVGKAEYLPGRENPRFIVTNLPVGAVDARQLYEDLYCIRGDMENRIKEQQLDLFAGRMSTHQLRSNQTRLYLASIAYVLVNSLRRIGLAGTELERAQCGTIRSKLLKIGGQIRVSVRKVWVSLSEAYPYQEIFATIHARLKCHAALAPG
jgi:hypothetical protein